MLSFIFYAFCLFLPFQFALNPAEGIDLAIIRIIIPFLFAAWLFLAFKNKSFSFLNNKITFCLLAFLLLAIFSLLFSENLSWSFRKLLFLITFFPLYFVAFFVFKEKKHQRRSIVALVSGGAVLAFFAIVQFVSQFIFGIEAVYAFLAQKIAPFFLGDTFSQSILTYPSWLVNSEGTTYMRAVANFPDPHMLSYYFGMLIPWSTALWATTKNHKYLFFVFFLLLVAADIMTFTRGGYIALIASSLIILPVVSKSTAKKLIMGMIIFIILLTAVPKNPVADRFTSSFDPQEGSNQGRIFNWKQSIPIILSHPFGVGIGMYPLAVKPDANYREPIYAHNLYLDIAAELGIAAAVVFVLSLFFVFKSFWQVSKTHPFFIAGIASVTVFSVHSLVESPLYSVHILPLILIFMALGTAITVYEKNNVSE